MKKICSKALAGIAAAALLLSGCSGFEGIEQISNNINELSSEINEIDMTPVSEGIKQSSETINELSEWCSEAAAETGANTSVLISEVQSININDLSEENIKNQLLGSAMEEVGKYQERGKKAIEEASVKQNDGIKKITSGAEDLIGSLSTAKTTDDVIDGTFSSARTVLNGANEMAAGATIVYQESVRSAKEIIELANKYGIDNEQINAIKNQLDKTADWEIYFISPDANLQLDELEKEVRSQVPCEDLSVVSARLEEEANKAAAKTEKLAEQAAKQASDNATALLNDDKTVNSAIEAIMSQAVKVSNEAKDTSDKATEIIAAINSAADIIAEQADAMGIDSKELDTINSYIDIASTIDLDTYTNISEDQLKDAEKMLKDAVSQLRDNAAFLDFDIVINQ